AGVVAAGFLMRPIGGWLFGYIADRHGRKASMLISVCMMCLGSLVIACLPGYGEIGLAAPVILLLARMFQGLSVGGEYGTSATYMSEVALEGRKGFYASFQYVTLIGGQLLAVLTVVVLQQILSDEELRSWGWRIPFFLGAALAVVALWLRRSLNETSEKKHREHRDAGSITGLLRNHTRAFLMVLGFTAGGSLSFYTFTTYMQKYLVNTAGMDARSASGLMTGCLLVFMLIQPIVGALSDKIGRRASMMIFGAGAAICTVPILLLLQNVQSSWLAFALIMLALIITSFYTAISGILKAEMFPPEVRALGVGLSYAVANAIFGGSAEYVALLLKREGIETSFFWYVSAMGALAFLVSLMLHRKGKGIAL
ncbi:MFS family transporter, partial [Pantoea endophytica]